jgi:anti-sigma factor RsiW
MNLTEEKLIAYADGEVSGEEMRAIEATLKARPDLQAFVEQQRALR